MFFKLYELLSAECEQVNGVTGQPLSGVTGQPLPGVTGQPLPGVTGQPLPGVTGQRPTHNLRTQRACTHVHVIDTL